MAGRKKYVKLIRTFLYYRRGGVRDVGDGGNGGLKTPTKTRTVGQPQHTTPS